MFHTLVVVAAFWGIVYSLDLVFRSYRPCKTQYLQCLENTGLSFSFVHIKWYTMKFNNLFKVWSRWDRRCARAWFGIGVVVGVLLMLASIVVLLVALYQALFSSSKSEKLLTPIMPGVNIPWSELVYYFVTLVVCGVFHEVGHALAAVTEQVRINGFGIFLFFLYPGAFVDLHPDHLTVISPHRQLRIYCAGVWHNMILTAVIFLLLLTLPYVLYPFYAVGGGAIVLSVAKESAVVDKLNVGEAITAVGNCKVHSTQEWLDCLDNVIYNSLQGYCTSNKFLANRTMYSINQTVTNAEGEKSCCWQESDRNICFAINTNDRFACLPARQIVSDETCYSSQDCKVEGRSCVIPAVGPQTRLLKIEHTGSGDPVLFLGDPKLLKFFIATSDYKPSLQYSPLRLPIVLQTFYMYLLSISSALALLNMVPAYALDGQWALSAILEMLMPESPYRNKILHAILIFGSILLALNILLALWILINW